MSPTEYASALAHDLGRETEFWDEIDSTNLRAKALARAGAKNGAAVIARRQTIGRGRMGRSFFSPDGGLYMSVILRPEAFPGDALLLTSMAAPAAARAIEALCPIKIGVKWINDLYCGGRKLAGILAEAGFSGESLSYIVLGIGVNLEKRDFPPELAAIATTVSNECGIVPDRLRLASEILNRLGEYIERLPDRGFIGECRARSILLGKPVTVIRGGDSYSAIARDIAPDGGLIVEEGGAVRTISSGEVSVRLL